MPHGNRSYPTPNGGPGEKADWQCCSEARVMAACRRGSMLGQRAVAPNFSVAPKCDMKHCLTNSKHRHIDAKRAFFDLQNIFPERSPPRTPMGSSQCFPRPLVSWGGNTLLIPHPTQRSIFPPWALATTHLDISGHYPQIVFSTTVRGCMVVMGTLSSSAKISSSFLPFWYTNKRGQPPHHVWHCQCPARWGGLGPTSSWDGARRMVNPALGRPET